MTGPIPIDQQVGAMLGRWPTLDVVERGKDSAVWRGTLKPILREYVVEIYYRVPSVLEMPTLRQQPLVRVLSPALKRRAGDPEGSLPHVYPDGTPHPPLCLFDMEAREWTPWKLLAETTVPWSIDWLACYEGWRATGTWSGGGRHPAAMEASR